MRELAIIILQHNTPGFVEDNLKALSKADLPENTEIIIINNGGNDANDKIDPKAYKGLKIKFFETPNDGFPAGNNFGMSKTESKYYAFINPDIVVNSDTFAKLLEYMATNPQAGIVSPQLIYKDGTVQDNYRVFPRIFDLIIKRIPRLHKLFKKRLSKYLMWDRDPNANQAVDWVTGAFTIVSSNCLEAIKKHDDENYFLFMSDVALCREAYKKGFETHIVGEVKCLHNDTRVSSGGLLDVVKKRIIRIHIADAISYFWNYKFEKLPKNCPSRRQP
jgi:N-acetylglucosaminyl-diphospho-decaprenol L-rhamnosyltransferase